MGRPGPGLKLLCMIIPVGENRTPFQRRIATVVPEADYAAGGSLQLPSIGQDIKEVFSELSKKIQGIVGVSFKGIGSMFAGVGRGMFTMFSGVAKVGMGIFGAISAIQIGWSIGTQIAEKFQFSSEKRMFQAIADAMVGKVPQGVHVKRKKRLEYTM